MFDRLVAFEDEFGHTSIPGDQSHAKLRSWVTVQRKRWRNNLLETERIELLEGLQTWEWEPKGRRPNVG